MTLNRVSAGRAALARGMTQIGVPYVFGGDCPHGGGCSPEGLDCDALAAFSWNPLLAAIGATQLVRPTYTTYDEYPFDSRNGNEHEPCQPGDLLFIPGGDPVGNEPGHVMIFHSPGVVLQAEETGTLVGTFPFDTASGWQYRTRPALAFPLPPSTCPHPTALDKRKAGLVGLPDPADAQRAVANGWPLWVWDPQTCWFAPAASIVPRLTPEYANRDWHTKR